MQLGRHANGRKQEGYKCMLRTRNESNPTADVMATLLCAAAKRVGSHLQAKHMHNALDTVARPHLAQDKLRWAYARSTGSVRQGYTACIGAGARRRCTTQ